MPVTILKFVCKEKFSETTIQRDSFVHVPKVGDLITLHKIIVFEYGRTADEQYKAMIIYEVMDKPFHVEYDGEITRITINVKYINEISKEMLKT